MTPTDRGFAIAHYNGMLGLSPYISKGDYNLVIELIDEAIAKVPDEKLNSVQMETLKAHRKMAVTLRLFTEAHLGLCDKLVTMNK